MGAEQASGSATPAATLLAMMRGYWVSQAIFVAARLGLADHLATGPRSAEELATATGVSAHTLRRLLRALTAVGVFATAPETRFALTPLSACLRSDAPGSLRASALVMGDLLYPAWAGLEASLRAGAPAFAATFGAEFFPYLQTHPHLGGRFQEMMADLNARTNVAVPSAYDFSGARRIVDVGGGNGSLLAAILRAYPAARGVLFDLPAVLDQARRQLREAGVAERCEIVGGDFFAGVPTGGDHYLLRWILHDYDDARATRILAACRAAMAPDGRLLVIEQVIEEEASDPASWATPFLDLQMLILLGGQERSVAEFAALFAGAGLTLRRVITTDTPMRILEAVPTTA